MAMSEGQLQLGGESDSRLSRFKPTFRYHRQTWILCLPIRRYPAGVGSNKAAVLCWVLFRHPVSGRLWALVLGLTCGIRRCWFVLYALAAMLIYIAFRFEWIYGVAAVLAVFHDTIITIGFFRFSTSGSRFDGVGGVVDTGGIFDERHHRGV